MSTVAPTTSGEWVASPPSVRVVPAAGAPVPEVAVTFEVTAGGGELTGAAQTTDAEGIATAGSWRVGTVVAGDSTALSVVLRDSIGRELAARPVDWSVSDSLVVRVSAGGFAHGMRAGASRVTAAREGRTDFADLTVRTGTAAVRRAASATFQEEGETFFVADPPAVRITDGHENPVTGVAVTFTVSAGGGTLTGATPTTDSIGIARIDGWQLGAPGTHRVRATSALLPGDSVEFVADAIVLPVATIEVLVDDPTLNVSAAGTT